MDTIDYKSINNSLCSPLLGGGGGGGGWEGCYSVGDRLDLVGGKGY